MYRILSIDGGGIRGVYPASFLADIEDELDHPINEYFDLIAGTSTGGIIAIGLSLGLSARKIEKMYEYHGPSIFHQERDGILGWIEQGAREVKWYFWGPKYSQIRLQNALTQTLGLKQLGEAKTRLLIPAWHREGRTGYVFKTAHHQRLQKDYKEYAKDVAMATAAAPTYFREHMTARGVGLVDGGIWANDPTGLAVAEAMGTLAWPAEELRVLSLGCLEDVIKTKNAPGAGRFAPKMASLFMAGQSFGSQGLAHILTGDVGGANHPAIYRITQEMPENVFKMDNTSKIPSLKSLAKERARVKLPDLWDVFFTETRKEFIPCYALAQS